MAKRLEVDEFTPSTIAVPATRPCPHSYRSDAAPDQCSQCAGATARTVPPAASGEEINYDRIAQSIGGLHEDPEPQPRRDRAAIAAERSETAKKRWAKWRAAKAGGE